MKDRKGWACGQSRRMPLDNGQPPSFVLSSSGCWNEAAPAISLERPCSDEIHTGSGWHFPVHLDLFPFSISHHYSNLQSFLLHCCFSIFLRKVNLCIVDSILPFPPGALRSTRLPDSRAMLFRKCSILVSLPLPRHPSHSPRRVSCGPRRPLSFCSSFLFIKMKMYLPFLCWLE